MSFKDLEIPFYEQKDDYIDNDEIYLNALEKYGAEKQLNKLNEECGELIQATSRKLNGQENNIAEELADVMIMIEQTILFHDLGDEVYKIKNEKLLRLKKRLCGEK